MTQAKTLRIGNKIQDEHGFIFDVVGIGKDWITVDFEGNEGDVWEFDFKHSFPKPIELTEGILLKCGFRKEKNVLSIYTLNSISIYWNSEYYPNGRLYFNSWCIHKEKPKHLHQLQNLYWCLCGEELEVNL